MGFDLKAVLQAQLFCFTLHRSERRKVLAPMTLGLHPRDPFLFSCCLFHVFVIYFKLKKQLEMWPSSDLKLSYVHIC